MKQNVERITSGDEKPAEQPPVPAGKPRGRDENVCDKSRILIADDEQSIREVFRRVLSYGLPKCRIDLAVNGAEAVESFRQAHQGVILMDLHMPVMSGDRAFMEIRHICMESGWEMPAVVFCTGYEPPHEIHNIVSENPKHCVLRKPVSNDTLIEALRLRMTSAKP